MRRSTTLLCVAVLAAGCSSGQAPAPEPPEPAVTEAAPPASPTPGPQPTPSASAPVPAQPPPSVPQDPAGLAATLTEAERAIRDDDDEAVLERAGQRQQAAYRVLASRPEMRPAVLASMPEDLHASVVAHTDALTDLLRLTKPQPGLPTWRIEAPPPPEELLEHYREAEREFGVGWQYLAAIHLVESRMGRIRGTSPAGAQGPMQFMPGTWAAYGEGDVDDPRDAVLAAGRYLRASGAPADMAKALFAYNRSEAYVRAITAHAELMEAEPAMYRGYWHWQVYYRTVDGDRVLPVGYDGTA